MSRPTEICSFVTKANKMADSKNTSYDIVRLENMCLRSELSRLSYDFEQKLEKQTEELNAISMSLSRTEGEVAEFKASQSNKFDSFQATQQSRLSTISENQKATFDNYKSSQQQILDQHTVMYTSNLTHYEYWTVGLSIILAIFGALSFFLITQYKKREIDQVVDNAVESATDKLNDDILVQSAVRNAFSSETVTELLDGVKAEIISEQESHIQSVIQDVIDMMSTNDTTEDVAQFQAVLEPELDEEPTT